DVVAGRVDYDLLNPRRDITVRLPAEVGPPIVFGHLPYAVGANLAFRRAVFDTVGGFDVSFQLGCDEVDFCWRAQYCGFTLGYAADAVVHYRLRSDFAPLFRQSFRYATGRAKLYAKHATSGHLRARGVKTQVWRAGARVAEAVPIWRLLRPTASRTEIQA